MSSEPQPADVPRFLSALQALGRGELDLATTFGVDSGILERVADRAVGLMQHGKLDQAEALLLSLSALAGSSETVPFLLGACRERRGDLPGALEAYDLALARDRAGPGSTFTEALQLARGHLLLRLGDRMAARAALTTAAAQRPGSPQSQAALTYLRCVDGGEA